MNTLLIQIILVAVTAGLIGYVIGRDTKHPIDVADIDAYLNEMYPDVWKAYHQGISEGYQQGLRDGGKSE